MFPTLSIHQEFGKIGIEAGSGESEIRQPRADMQITTTPAKLEMRSPKPELSIDQSQAWEALTGGKVIPFNNRIYSQNPQIFLQSLANIVERGNKLAAFHKGYTAANVLGPEWQNTGTKLDYVGPAGYDNVDIHFTTYGRDLQVTEGDVQLSVRVNPPDIQYHPKNVRIWMERFPSLIITPPSIDLKG